MRTRPAWLAYAGRIKSKTDQLPPPRKAARRERILYRSYLEARERFHYPGTLGDWLFVVESSKGTTATRVKASRPADSVAAAARRSRVSNNPLRPVPQARPTH
ncbi:MAG TPA: hypothetical protein VFZ59_13960 [Verrucomicrobiae bacterium]|nr:hypothetical protein [Verrucomicrobiae bacterium]